MNKVLISHPGLQHSHQMAMAICEKQFLFQYWSGIPVRSETESGVVNYLPASVKKKIKIVNVPKNLRRHYLVFPLLVKVVQRIMRGGRREDWIHRVFHLYDYWVSLKIPFVRPKAVIAYENSAFYTFAAAKKYGAVCVLEAPSLHHKTAAKLIAMQTAGYLTEINRRKDAEISMADAIITCSPIARLSYLDAGVGEEKVTSLLLGAELPVGIETVERASVTSGVPRFIFAGTMSLRKSIDILIEVFSNINREKVMAELYIFGGTESEELLSRVRTAPGIRYQPQVSQADLYLEMAKSDCLLLVSRFDSFGMVVAEAMSVGVPALVSTMTGSRIIIEDTPGSGWIVEPTYVAVRQKIAELLDSPEELRSASRRALQAAQKYTWSAYRGRAGEYIESIVRRASK